MKQHRQLLTQSIPPSVGLRAVTDGQERLAFCGLEQWLARRF